MTMMANAPHDVLSGNRARGRIALHVASSGGATCVARLREEGSFRIRFPARAQEAVLINTAGGVAGGDSFTTDIRLDAQAQMAVTTAAAEKIYRALGPPARLDIKLTVQAGATLRWLPQETILFDRARLDRTITVDAAAGARLIMAEALVFGRAAMGETFASGRLIERWRVRVDERLVFADGIRLTGDIARTLAAPAALRGGAAVATVLMLPGDDEMVAAVRACEPAFRGEVGASAWNGLALARLAAPDGAALRHDLTAVLAALGCPLPRLWSN